MRARLAAIAAVALVAFVPPALANHTQTDSGKGIVFDHKTGNIHWVEVLLFGADAGKVAKVEAQVGAPNGRGWTHLPKLSWGSYGASFPIGDPADVRFRATFTDGTLAVSCWFRHPSGVEVCSYAPPPGTWNSATVGEVGRGFGGESTVADVDRDGVGEVLVASETGLHLFYKTATGWSRSTVLAADPDTDGPPVQEFRLVTAGSTDGDDVLEVYTVGRHYDGQRVSERLMWHHFTGERWFSEVVWDFRSVSDILIGNIDDDGTDELIAITHNGDESIAYAIERSPGFFSFTELARTPHDFDMGRAAVADADRDLDQELYILYGTYPDFQAAILRVDKHLTGYVQDTIVRGDFGHELTGFAAGDGDNDGLAEIYLLSSGFFAGEPTNLHRFSFRDAGWAHTAIPMGKGLHYDLHLGDGNGDGFRELYSGTQEGHLAQVTWTGSAWSARAVVQLGSGEFIQDVTTGDTDGDGKREVYGVSYASPSSVCCPTTHLVRMGPLAGPPPPPPGFNATFTGVRGNEWWVQANVAAAGGTLAKVDVSLNGGAWKPLTKQSWGGWAASYHIVQGTVVQLRATSTTGAADPSECYQWIPPSNADASKVACGSPPPAFDATFSGVKGNEWWVQANVAANQPLAGVDARVNCSGSWIPLTLQSWGGWAKSFHVPNGAKVDFRARSTSGATDLSGGYIWPNATPAAAC